MKLTKSSRAFRRATALVLAAALTLSAPVATNASAATKKVPSLSVKKKTLYYNKAGKKSFTLKIKKNKVKKIVSTKWTTSKKSVAKISKAKKTSVKVTAVKKGSAKIKATVKYKVGSTTRTKKLTCNVTSKKYKANVTAAPSSTAVVTEAPATDTPAPATATPAPATDTPAPATDTPAPATDTPAPATEELKVTAVTPLTSTKVNVTFSKAIDKTTDASKFTVSDGATVSGVELSEDATVATLVINGLVSGKEYTLTVAGVTGENAKLDSYEAKFTAKSEQYTLELDDGIEDGNTLKADGTTSTKVTVKLVNSNGEVVKDADQVELKFDTTAGNFANQRVTVQNGVAENTFTSESLVAAKTALITVTIINAKDTSLINTTNTMNIVMDPNPATSADDSVGATLTDIKVQTADKIALFFNKEVKVTDYTLNNKNNNDNYFGLNPDKIELTVTDKATGAGNVTVQGLSAIEGNKQALYAHLNTELTDNAKVTVKMVDKTKKVPVSAEKTATLQDITAPSVLNVTNSGLTKIVLTFSEAVNPYDTMNSGATKISNYVIDGISLTSPAYGVTTAAKAERGGFSVKDASDTKNIVTITLGKDKDGKQIYLKSGKHSIQVSNVGDAANVTDKENNKLITQTLDFTIPEDNEIVTATVEVQSPEQYVVILNKDIGDAEAEALIRANLKLQKWNATTSKYEDFATHGKGIEVRQAPRKYGEDPKKFIVEVTKDWTEVYNTKETHKNYYNDNYRLFIAKETIANPANGKLNNDIELLLNDAIMKNPDVTSPQIQDVTFNATAKTYAIMLSEPVQVPGKNTVAVTPNQTQKAGNGVPNPTVAFIKSDNSETIPAKIEYNWTYDNGIVVTPTANLSAGTWKVVVYSISDDVGNTAATLVKPDFTIDAPVIVADTFRPLWVVAVPAGATNPIGNVTTAHDVVYVKYSKNISTAGSSANVISTANYQVNGYQIPVSTKVDVSIPGYNDDVVGVYGANAMKDIVAIYLNKGTLAAKSNNVYIAPTLESADGAKIENAGLKTLDKTGDYFTWNYKTTTHNGDTVKLTKASDVQAALNNDENVSIKTDSAITNDDKDITLDIKKALEVDFSGATIKSLNIDTQATGTIKVTDLKVTNVTVNAPNADVVFEKVTSTGKVDLKNVLKTFSLDANTSFAELNVTADVKHDITVKGAVGATITTVNNAASATVTFDPLVITTMNQLSAQEFVLDKITLGTLNIRAAATIRLENNDSTITTMNIQKDVKLAKFVVGEGVATPNPTVNKDVTYKTDGAVDNAGTPAENKSDYITDGKISVTVKDVDIEMDSSDDITNLNNSVADVTVTSTGAAVSINDYGSNVEFGVQLPKGTSIKDYKGIKFDVIGYSKKDDQYGVLNYKDFSLQMAKDESLVADPEKNVLVGKYTAKIDKEKESKYTTIEIPFDWTKSSDINAEQLKLNAFVKFALNISTNMSTYGFKNVKLYV